MPYYDMVTVPLFGEKNVPDTVLLNQRSIRLFNPFPAPKMILVYTKSKFFVPMSGVLRNWDTLRWPTDDGLQGLLTHSLQDELEHHIWCRRYMFPVEQGRSMAQLKLTVTDEREDAQMRLRRVSGRGGTPPAFSASKEPLGSKTLFDRRLHVSHAPQACRQLRNCQKNLE